jgi:hypothetical protein
MIRSELSSSQRGRCLRLEFVERSRTQRATRVQIPNGIPPRVAQVLRFEIRGVCGHHLSSGNPGRIRLMLSRTRQRIMARRRHRSHQPQTHVPPSGTPEPGPRLPPPMPGGWLRAGPGRIEQPGRIAARGFRPGSREESPSLLDHLGGIVRPSFRGLEATGGSRAIMAAAWVLASSLPELAPGLKAWVSRAVCEALVIDG